MKTASSSLVHRLAEPEHRPATRCPTLIMLHGRGADEEDLLGLSPYLDNRFLILSVRAPYPFSDGNGYTWYDMGEMLTPEATMFKESYEKLSGFVHDALEHYPVDKERIFLLGFSMGTVMCYSLALTHPGLFRGVVANSGYVAENTHLLLRWNEALYTEFFIAHGSYDQVIPVRFGRRARELCTAAGVRYTYREIRHGASDHRGESEGVFFVAYTTAGINQFRDACA